MTNTTKSDGEAEKALRAERQEAVAKLRDKILTPGHYTNQGSARTAKNVLNRQYGLLPRTMANLEALIVSHCKHYVYDSQKKRRKSKKRSNPAQQELPFDKASSANKEAQGAANPPEPPTQGPTNYKNSIAIRPSRVMTNTWRGKTTLRVLIDQAGGVHFVAKDVCNALGIRSYKAAVNTLPDDAKGGGLLDNSSSTRAVSIVTLAGLHRLVRKSDRKDALEFSDWVCEEVLTPLLEAGAADAPPDAQLGDLLREQLQELRELRKGQREGQKAAREQTQEIVEAVASAKDAVPKSGRMDTPSNPNRITPATYIRRVYNYNFNRHDIDSLAKHAVNTHKDHRGSKPPQESRYEADPATGESRQVDFSTYAVPNDLGILKEALARAQDKGYFPNLDASKMTSYGKQVWKQYTNLVIDKESKETPVVRRSPTSSKKKKK